MVSPRHLGDTEGHPDNVETRHSAYRRARSSRNSRRGGSSRADGLAFPRSRCRSLHDRHAADRGRRSIDMSAYRGRPSTDQLRVGHPDPARTRPSRNRSPRRTPWVKRDRPSARCACVERARHGGLCMVRAGIKGGWCRTVEGPFGRSDHRVCGGIRPDGNRQSAPRFPVGNRRSAGGPARPGARAASG